MESNYLLTWTQNLNLERNKMMLVENFQLKRFTFQKFNMYDKRKFKKINLKSLIYLKAVNKI